MQKISDNTKQSILTDFSSGLNKAQIARKYGISWQSVHFVINPAKVAENRQNTVKNPIKNCLRVAAWRLRQKENLKNV